MPFDKGPGDDWGDEPCGLRIVQIASLCDEKYSILRTSCHCRDTEYETYSYSRLIGAYVPLTVESSLGDALRAVTTMREAEANFRANPLQGILDVVKLLSTKKR